MDKISASMNLQAPRGYTDDRSLTKPPCSEQGDTQEQASPAGMPQTVKEIYRAPLALRDWWILNLLLNWFLFFFTATPGPSPHQPQPNSPEGSADSRPTPNTGNTINYGNGNNNCGNVNNSNNTSTTYNNKAEKIFGGGASNNFAGATFH